MPRIQNVEEEKLDPRDTRARRLYVQLYHSLLANRKSDNIFRKYIILL